MAPTAKRAAKPDPSTMCRGKWSVCGGKNSSKSAGWHICDSCTKKRAAAMKAEAKAADPKPIATPSRSRRTTKVAPTPAATEATVE